MKRRPKSKNSSIKSRDSLMMFMTKRMIINGRLLKASLTLELNILKKILRDLSTKLSKLNSKVLNLLSFSYKNSKILKQEKPFKKNFKRSIKIFYISMKESLLRWKQYSQTIKRNLQLLKTCLQMLEELLGLDQSLKEWKFLFKNWTLERTFWQVLKAKR